MRNSAPKISILLVAAPLVLSACSSALVDAAKQGRADAIRSLLPGDRRHCGAALREAAARNKVEAIAALLDGGCDVNSKDRDGYTPLMLAAMSGRNDCVRLLLIRRADPELVTWNDKTAAFLARERGHKDSAALIDQGALIAFAAPTGAAASPAHRLVYDLFRFTREGDKKGQARAAAAVLKAGAPAVTELARAAGGDGVVDDLDPRLKGKDIRLVAIKVLGLMGPTAADALPALSAALDDADLHEAASAAIRRVRAQKR